MLEKIKRKITEITDRLFSKTYIINKSSRGNLTGPKFPSGMSRPSAAINIHDHYSLRQRSRDMMFDSIECRALIESQVDITIDAGLRPKSVPIASLLGITQEEAEAWGEEVDERFHLWANSKKSHHCRINNFYQNTRLYELQKRRDNDIFVSLFYERDKDQINPLSIDFVDPNQIRGFGFTSSYTNHNYDDGIIRDGKGREKGYKIWTYDFTSNKYTEKIIPAIGEKSGRLFMLHGYNPEYPGQGRGFPKITHLLQELENLTDYRIAVLQKSINQASIIGVVENEFQDASQPFEGRAAGPRSEYGISPDASEDVGTGKSEDPVINWDSNPEVTIRKPGLFVGNLRRGDEWKNLQDTAPGPQFESFVDNVFSYIAASTGDSIEVVKKKFSNNYSASRGTLILIWRKANIEKNDTVSDFCDPVREMFIAEEIAAGRIQAPGWSDPLMRMAWLCCEWRGVPMPNIDPKSTMEADRGYVEMCAQTLDDVSINLNGSSGKANRAKNARQFEELPTPPWPRAPLQLFPDNTGGNSGGNE